MVGWLSIEEEVEGVGIPIKDIELSVEEGVESSFSVSILSFNLFVYVLCDFLQCSCL